MMPLDGTVPLKPTAEYIRQRVSYDPATGAFTWQASASMSVQWNGRFAGKPAGSIDSDTGYRRIRIDNQPYYGHRLAWLIVNGYWPDHEVDHRNGDRTDNRFGNLRLATHTENAQNAALRRDNASGRTGVWFDNRARKWCADLQVDGRRVRRSGFHTPEAAHAFYLEAKREHHTFQPVPRQIGGGQ